MTYTFFDNHGSFWKQSRPIRCMPIPASLAYDKLGIAVGFTFNILACHLSLSSVFIIIHYYYYHYKAAVITIIPVYSITLSRFHSSNL